MYLNSLTRASCLAAALVATVSAPQAVFALVWDIGVTSNDNLITGGSGSWSTTNTFWATDPTGAVNQAWVDDAAAVFSAAGTTNDVTIDGTIKVSSITFDIAGYNIKPGTGTLELTGAAALVVNANATISAAITGSNGLNISGAGVLDLTAANSYTNGTTLGATTVRVGNDGALSSGAVTVNGAATLASTSATTRLLANNLVLNANTTFGQAAGGTGALTFSGTVDLGGGAPRTLTVVNTTTLSGAVSNGALTKAGAGMLVLSGTNSYAGATAVSAGILRATTAGALSSTSGITVADTAALELDGGFSVNVPLTITGQGGTNGALRSQTGANTWAGNITLGANNTRLGTGAAGASLTVSGVIDSGANNYGLAIRAAADTDVVTLSGINTYLGGTTVVVGTLKIAGGDDRLPTASVLTIGNSSNVSKATFDLNGLNQTVGGLVHTGGTMTNLLTNTSATASILTINVAGTNSYTYGTATSSIAGNLSIVKTGTGTQVISGANTYTGNTTVNAGILTASTPGSLPGYATAGRVSVNNATLAVQVGSAGQWTATNIDTLVGVTPDIFPTGTNLGIDVTTGTFTYDNVVSGPKGLVKLGTGTLALGGTNTYAGNTTISNGFVTANNNSAFSTGTVTMAAGSSVSRLTLGNGVNIANDFVFTSGDASSGRGVLEGPATGSATYSGKITFNANSPNGGHINGGAGLIIAGPMVQAGTASNINIREGLVTLANAVDNNYTALAIATSTTTLAVDNAIDVDATVSLASVGNTTLNLNNFNQAITGLNFGNLSNPNAAGTVNTGTGVLTLNGNVTTTANATHTINGNLNLGGATRTFDVYEGTSTPDLLINAVISNGSLTKVSTGTLDLTGANTYAGGTTLTSGTLRLGNNAALGTGLLTVNGSGTTVASTGLAGYALANGLKLITDPTFGQTTLGSGALSFAGNVDLDAGTRYLTVNNTTTLAGAVGNGAFYKMGNGTLILSGDNTLNQLTGAVDIAAGTLSVTSANALKGMTALNVGGGTTFAFGSGAGTILTPTATGTAMTINSNATLRFALGTDYDKIDLLTNSATTYGPITISGTALPSHAAGNVYNLLKAAGGLSNTYNLGFLPPGYTYSLAVSDTEVNLTTGAAPSGPYYWIGNNPNATSWAVLGNGTDSNWATDAAGATDAAATPSATTDVVFSATGFTASADFTTTLDGPYSIKSLKFIATANVTGKQTIAPGNGGTLEIGEGGLELQRAAQLPTISAPVILGAAQRWNINNASANNALLVTGPLSGSAAATLTKVGNARLELNNQASGVASTNAGNIYVNEGHLLLRVAAMGVADGPVLNPAGTGDIYLSAPGGTFYLRYDGDNSSTNRDYTFGNNLIVNRPVTVDLDRTSVGSNKNSVFSSLTINNTQLSINQNGNGYRLAISGNINLIGDSAINAGDMTNMISGKITDNGKSLTLNKLGGSTLNILGTGNDYSGGTVIHGSTLRIGSGYGTAAVNPTATAGTGPIIVGPGSRGAFTYAGNVGTGQTIDLVSTSAGSFAVLEVGSDHLPLSAVRTLTTGLLEVGGGTPLTQALDQSRLGDGTWLLTASSTYGSGTIGVGATIQPGAGNLFRIGGNANTLTINAVDYFTGTAGLELGGPFVNGAALGGSNTVLLTSTNTYSGPTTVSRGQVVRFQQGGTAGSSATGSSLGTTSGINIYGTLTAETSGSNHGTFFDSTGNPVAIALFGGSKLYLDNNAITTAGANVDRWGNATPIAMNQLDFEIRSRNVNAADVTTEDVGPISVANGNLLRLTRSQAVAGHNVVLQADSLTRVGAGTLEIVRNTGVGAGLGGGQKLIIDTGATGILAPVNGMTTPWIANWQDKTHVTYGANGFASVTYVTTATLNNGTELYSTTGEALTATRDVYALKQTGAITGVGQTARIRSGGLIADFASTSLTNTANLFFNDGVDHGGTTNIEGLIFVDDSDTLVQSGTITANGFTKFGGGQLTINASNLTTMMTGSVYVNRGTLQLENTDAVGGRPIYVTSGGTLNLRQADTAAFSSGVTLTQDNPIGNVSVGRLSGSLTNRTLTIPTLTLAGSAGTTGQTLNLTGNNDFDLAVSGATTVNGNVTFYANTGSTALYLDGGLTSNTAGAVITKAGTQVMRVAGSGTTAAGTQLVVNAGTLELRSGNASTAAGFTPIGAGANTTIILNTGTLNLRTAGAEGTFGGTGATTGGYAVIVNGDSTISVDRTGGTNTDKQLRIGSLTIGSQTLNITGGNNWVFAVNGATTLNGDPTIIATAPTPELKGKVSGGRLIKQGNATLRLSAVDNTNTYDGGTLINAGWVAGYNARGLGTGDIIVNPGGGVAVNKATTLLAGQKAILRSSSLGLAMVGQNFGTSTAPSTMLPNLDLSLAPVGIFGGGSNYTTPLDMSDLFGATVSGDDDWYLGGIAYNDTYYRADTFTASTNGNTYRLGGGGGNMQINRNNATPNTGVPGTNANNLLTDLPSTPTSVTIGMPAQNLRTQQSSEVVIAGTNNYTGGSTINRGAVMHLASAANTTTGMSGAGNGTIDIYGRLTLRTAGTLTNGTGGNVNAVVTHPGSRILLDNNTSSVGMNKVQVGDRWGDSAPVTLNGARFELNGYDYGTGTATNLVEQIGDVTFDRGASLRVTRNGTNATPPRVYLKMNSLARSGSGTLLLVQGNSLLPDQTTSDNLERFIITGGTTPAVNNGIVAPWFIDANDHRFVTYNSGLATDGNVIGFQQSAFSQSITTGTYGAGALGATDVVDVNTAALTLADNPTIYALKTNQNINAAGANNTITIQSGGFIGAGGTTNANLVFNNGTSNIEALIYTGGNTALQGTVTATQITKFGYAELQLDRATPVFEGPLVINNGGVRVLQLGALSATQPITLSGSGSDNGDDASGTGLFFAANIASGEEQVYTHGDVTSWDNSRVLFITGGSDRTQRAGNFILKSTAASNGLSVVQFRVENSRQRISLGNVTFDSPNAILQVHNNSFTSGGASSVVAPADLIGTGKNITKLGTAMLELTNLTPSLTNSTLTISQGALRVANGTALGTTNIVIIEQGAALEIAGSNFTVTGTTLTQNWGSGERWNVEDARGTGNYTVPNGVNLQLNTNLLPTTPRTITLDGGALEGFLYTDALAKAVFRTVGANVTLNLASNSYIGQNLYVGQNGSDAGIQGNYPDRNPITGDVRGAILVVEGAITGATSDLTKVGRDLVVLAGANTYRNTIVEQGILRLGATNTLPTAGILTTRFDGLVDMNGFSQTVANLGTKDGDPSPGGVGVNYSGLVTNSAYDLTTLTAGNADNYTYNGDILGNVNLVKQGAGELKLGGTLGYVGTTTVNAGVLYLAGSAPPALVSASTVVANDAGIVLPFGGSGRLDAAGVDAFRTTATLGTNLTIGFDVADTYSYTYTTLFPTANGFIKGGLGTIVLPTSPAAWSKGISLRGGTTEFVAGALGTTEAIGLLSSNTIRWSSGNTEDISGRLAALPADATTTFDVGTNNVVFASGLAGAATSNLVKVGAGTLTLNGTATYGGATNISAGTVVVGAANALSTTGLLTIGSGTSVVSLAVNADQTVAGLLVATNSATANTITLAAGKTLTSNGTTTIGTTGSGSVTKLNVSGAPGSSVVLNGGINIATTTVAADAPNATLTIAGAGFSANLGAGALVIGQRTVAQASTTNGVYGTLDLSNASAVSITGATNASSIVLGNNGYNGAANTNGDICQGTLNLSLNGANTVQVGTITLGTSPNSGVAGIQGFLNLGNAANNFNVDTIYVGRQKSQIVGSQTSLMKFAGTGGTLTLGGFVPGSKANLNIGYNDNANTGTVSVGNVDLTGGSFNGTLGTVTIGLYAGTGSGGGKGTLTIAGGSTTADAVVLATAAGSTSAANNAGTLNLNGGSFTLAPAGSGIANAGGTTVTGTATLNLNGGTLDMSDTNIGAAAPKVVTLNAQSGTLKNVASINGAGGLNKTTPGTLILDGTNTYTGNTQVNAGMLLATKPAALPGYNASKVTPVAANATLAVRAGTASDWLSADVDAVLGATGAAFAANSNFGIEVLAPNSFTYANDLGATVVGKGFVKLGAGALTLSGASTYTGPTDVQAGTLLVNGSVTGAGNVTVASGATLGGAGSLAGAVAVNASGFIAPNGLASDTGTLNLGGTLTINGTAKFELGAAASDKIVVAGAADFNGGTLDVTALTVGGPTFANGQVFDLFDYASYTNPFATINLPLLTGGLQWKSFGAQQFDYTNGQIVVESTVVTPAIRTWDGGSSGPGDNLWSTAANWGTSGVPVNNTPKNELVFGGSTRLANNNDIASLSVGKLTFASGAGGFDLQGTALEIAGKIDNQATTAQKISLNVTFAAGTETATLNVVNAGSLELAGAVNSTLGLTKTGLGTAKLSALTGSTYSGPTLVNEGTLEVTKGINLVADTDDTTVGTSTTTATLITEHIRQDVLTINAGSKVKISATGGAASTSVVNVLNIANASGSFSWSVPGGDISPAATGGPVASGAAVPEPATWLLAVMAALAGLVAWRRRK